MFSGWGIRTLSASMVGYNPIGYHLGTIWPHDNAICAAGFARYGLREEARKVAGALLEATLHFRDARLPELFCGFDRDYSPLPVPYPVACSPQAWAAGSLFHMLSATLGLRADARANSASSCVGRHCPTGWPICASRNLRVGDALVDLAFDRDDGVDLGRGPAPHRRPRRRRPALTVAAPRWPQPWASCSATHARG